MNERPVSEHEPYTGYTDSPDEHLVEGFDLQAIEELGGIPFDDESLSRHIESGKEVARQLSKSALAADGGVEHAQLEAKEGVITCGTCNRPGCRGCGR